MDHGDGESARVRIGALERDHLLYPAKKRAQETHAKDEVRGGPSVRELLVHRLQLSFAGRSLLLPKREIFGMSNDVLHDGRR